MLYSSALQNGNSDEGSKEESPSCNTSSRGSKYFGHGKKIYIFCKRTSWELPYESCLFLLKTCIMGKRSGQNGLNFDLGTMEKILDEAIRETNFLHML